LKSKRLTTLLIGKKKSFLDDEETPSSLSLDDQKEVVESQKTLMEVVESNDKTILIKQTENEIKMETIETETKIAVNQGSTTTTTKTETDIAEIKTETQVSKIDQVKDEDKIILNDSINDEPESSAIADVIAAIEKSTAESAASNQSPTKINGTTPSSTPSKKKKRRSDSAKKDKKENNKSLTTIDNYNYSQQQSKTNGNNGQVTLNQESPSPSSSSQKRRKKDPLAPKAPLNGYLVYFNKERAEMKDKNPTMSFGELTKIIANQWKELSSDEKQYYINEVIII
jgi:hypothetical protein